MSTRRSGGRHRRADIAGGVDARPRRPGGPDRPSRRRGRLALALRVGSVRFAGYYFAAFVAGIVHAGGAALRWSVPAAVICIANCLAIELINRYADRTEDAVNRPERTALCEALDFATILRIAVLLWAVLAATYGIWFAVDRNPELLAVQVISWLIGWNYSVGLRFKARPYGVLVVLTSTFVLPYLFGWSIVAPLARVPLGILCVPTFIASLSGIKDVTDEEGDRLRGYRSRFLALVRGRSAGRLVALLAAPYLLAFVLVVAGAAPVRLAGFAILAPGSLLFAILVRNVASREEAMAVRECMYHFWFVAIALDVWLIQPSTELAACLVAAAAFWIAASRRMHWMPGLQRAHLTLSWAVALRARRQAPRAEGSWDA
ncbi:MAG TPA: UbiA family prenyltransferase [Kofleriaceae bacterium]|nr:UbiA family prenyltransferase [Kofleriaceae bacterium]